MQPAWVHTAVNASNESACGWVITIFWLPRILPPPTGMSAVLASTGGPFEAVAPELGLVDAAVEEPLWAGWLAAIPPLLEL